VRMAIVKRIVELMQQVAQVVGVEPGWHSA
jgi:hypothetical protein